MRALHDKNLKGRVYDTWSSAARKYPSGLRWHLEVVLFHHRMHAKDIQYKGFAFLANEVLSRVRVPFAGILAAPARAMHIALLPANPPPNPPPKPQMRRRVHIRAWPLCADQDPAFTHCDATPGRWQAIGGKK